MLRRTLLISRQGLARTIYGLAGARANFWEWSPFYLASNANKRGLTLNLTDPRGQAIGRKLAAQAQLPGGVCSGLADRQCVTDMECVSRGPEFRHYTCHNSGICVAPGSSAGSGGVVSADASANSTPGTGSGYPSPDDPRLHCIMDGWGFYLDPPLDYCGSAEVPDGSASTSASANLLPHRQYYWQVRAVNSSGSTLA